MNKEGKERTDIERLLSGWQVSTPVQPDLKQRVLRRIALNEAERTREAPTWMSLMRLFSESRAIELTLAGLILLVTVVSIFAIHERKMRMEAEYCREYFLEIDPIAHAMAIRDSDRPKDANEASVVDMLGWMKDRLGLSREQFARMVDLHRNFSTKFTFLYTELCEIDDEYKVYENSRLNDQDIDFMAFYDLLQKRNLARADSMTTSKELVEIIYTILTPEQKAKFISLFSNKSSSNKNTPTISDIHAGA